jgi:predicted ATP-dependent endonuclease of OLD family
MRIESVMIKNFRSLKDVSISFDSVTTFIGPNGTGKSTVLRALDWFFNGTKGNELTEKDSFFGLPDEDIEVRVTFSGLTVNDHIMLEKYAPAEATTFTAWKIHHHDGTEILSANLKTFPPFAEIRKKTAAGDKKSAYNELRTSDTSLELPPWSNQDESMNYLTTWESNHIDKLVESPSELQTNFFGFNSNGKLSGLFDYVFVAADLRANEEAQDAKASVIGRILERSIDRSLADEAIKNIIAESRQAQQRVCDEKFGAQLDTIKRHLNRVVSAYSPGRSISVMPAEMELKAPKATFNLSVFDGPIETAIEGQGHGFQRTLLISALQVLAESTAAATEGVFCLAIEEPELFQHPTQAQAFARILRALAEDPNKRVQIVYATHSPLFIEARHFDQIRRFSRNAEVPPIVTVYSSTIANVKQRLSGIQDPESVERQLDSLAIGQTSSAFFASFALVVEGTTEAAVFYGIGDKVSPANLEANGVSIVPANGKSSVPLTHAVLVGLGIPCYAVFDSDSGFELRALAQGKTQDKINEERRNHINQNKTLLRYFDHAEVDFPVQTVTNNVAIFPDHLKHSWIQNGLNGAFHAMLLKMKPEYH